MVNHWPPESSGTGPRRRFGTATRETEQPAAVIDLPRGPPGRSHRPECSRSRTHANRSFHSGAFNRHSGTINRIPMTVGGEYGGHPRKAGCQSTALRRGRKYHERKDATGSARWRRTRFTPNRGTINHAPDQVADSPTRSGFLSDRLTPPEHQVRRRPSTAHSGSVMFTDFSSPQAPSHVRLSGRDILRNRLGAIDRAVKVAVTLDSVQRVKGFPAVAVLSGSSRIPRQRGPESSSRAEFTKEARPGGDQCSVEI